jgi:Domain of unknown function (DUF4265)
MNERVKIDFRLNPEDRQGFETEGVWAERVGPNEFRILNSPFFVFGVSADDIVNAEMKDGTYKFDRVVRKGGHSTYRIFLQGGRTINDENFRARWAAIQTVGGTFENANDRLLSIDLPPNVNVVKVYELLKQGEGDGVWAFEEGNYEGGAA